MATGTINWTPTNGGSYEIWYGKLSVLGTSSLPPAAGWTQAPGSPFFSTLGTASITGLDDNTQYRVDSRADCTGLDSSWIDNIKYKLVCPSLSVVANPLGAGPGGSITATITPVNVVEFSAIVQTMTLVIRNTATTALVETKVFPTPFTSPTTYTFNNLPVSTQYTVYLTIHDGIASQDITCSNQSAIVPTPVVTPPPVCTVPTFTLSGITQTSVTINVTSTLLTGDTIDVSLDGGETFTIIGQTNPTIVISTGITPSTTYTVLLRRNCQAGGQGTSTSQTFTTASAQIQGFISLNSNINSSGGAQGSMFLLFTFPAPTPAPIQLLFGWTAKGTTCTLSNGTDIFVAPPGAQNCISFPNGDTSQGRPPNSAFVVNIPAGVTSFNSGTNIRTTSPTNSADPWINPSHTTFTDLYVKVASPTGYVANFRTTPGANVTVPFIHNV